MKISLAVPAAVIIAAGGLMVAGCGGSTETTDTATGVSEWSSASSAAISSGAKVTGDAAECPTDDVLAWESCMQDLAPNAWLVHDEIQEAAEMGLKLDMPAECTAVARQQLKIADEYMVMGDHMKTGLSAVDEMTTSVKAIRTMSTSGVELTEKCVAAIENGGV